MTQTPDTAALEAMLEKATPGPWIDWAARVVTAYGGPDPSFDCDPIFIADCDMDVRIDHDTVGIANAALIALAPTLAAEVIRLRADAERLREALGSVVNFVTAAAIEEETSTHVVVSFCEPDAGNILRAALRARAALNDGGK